MISENTQSGNFPDRKQKLKRPQDLGFAFIAVCWVSVCVCVCEPQLRQTIFSHRFEIKSISKGDPGLCTSGSNSEMRTSQLCLPEGLRLPACNRFVTIHG